DKKILVLEPRRLAARAVTERLTGCEVERAYVDKGYRGHSTANPRRVFISGQKRGVFGAIKREATASDRHRSRHRPHEERWPSRALLSQGPRRRCRSRAFLAG